MSSKGRHPLPPRPSIGRQARRWWRDLQPKHRESEAEPADKAHRRANRGDPAALARLRRAAFVSEALAEEATLDLFRQLELTVEQACVLPRVAVIAMVLAHVREDPPPNENGGAARAVGRKSLDDADSAKMKPLRFRRLLACRDDEDLAREMRRLVALAGQRVNVGDLAASLFFWDEKTRARWAFDYYGAGFAAPPESTEGPAPAVLERS
jgi:CRISPR system Cascade subunit CasB